MTLDQLTTTQLFYFALFLLGIMYVVVKTVIRLRENREWERQRRRDPDLSIPGSSDARRP